MKVAKAQSRCECQATLIAEVDEQGRVLSGAVIQHGVREKAPANAMGAGQARFDIGWLCPVCGRNTLRSFELGGLTFEERPSEKAS